MTPYPLYVLPGVGMNDGDRVVRSRTKALELAWRRAGRTKRRQQVTQYQRGFWLVQEHRPVQPVRRDALHTIPLNRLFERVSP